MLRDVVQNADLTLWPQIALVLFMAIFALAVVWVLLPKNRQPLMAAARLPLADEDDGTLPEENLL